MLVEPIGHLRRKEANEMNSFIAKYPLIEKMMNYEAVFWENPKLDTSGQAIMQAAISASMIEDAANRLERFAPYIAKAFPETASAKGFIESPITAIPKMKEELEKRFAASISGPLLLKQDNALPISGSIKARGGIYEVLKHAEQLAIQHGLLTENDSYDKLHEPTFREFFSTYKIAVGSTGNLGLSIGIMSAKLGFNVTVHMSMDAKEWKKQLLRDKGVTVIEYEADYSKAVEEGRKQAIEDPYCHFVDDENSVDLFVGYAVAGQRVADELARKNIVINEQHPLFVYLPCGVGGGPGGVAFGLKQIFGNAVKCFFAEPTHSPCMLLGMMTGLHDQIAVSDIGLDNQTAADGLAVGTPSSFVGKTMERLLDGCYTVEDKTLFKMLNQLADSENIWLEPSALAGMTGPYWTIHEQFEHAQQATHLVWATGGSMVPQEEMRAYYEEGTS